jgi:dTDP-4-dehydrorhamnose reductase
MIHILVIGSNGQLASELKEIQGHYSELVCSFLAKEEIRILDKSDISDKIAQFRPEFIVNCSAYTAVDKAESAKDDAFAINEIGVKNVADVAAENGIHLIHISTDFVFDGKKSSPYNELDSVNPMSIYGESKLAGERAVQNSGCHYTIIRTSWLYSSFGANFVKTMIRFGNERESLNVVFDQVGTPTYARDLAEFILENIRNFSIHTNEVYHYSNEGVASWYDFAIEIMQLKKIQCKIFPILSSGYPTPAKRPPYSVLDKTKIKDHYRIIIPHWKESLEKCIRLI